jgi:outer membrane protein OmpA-like peptidoglycan-associated protein
MSERLALRGHGPMWRRCPPQHLDPLASCGVAAGSHPQQRLLTAGPILKAVVIMLGSMLLMLTPRAFAQDDSQSDQVLAIGVGDPGSPSYMVGLWLTSLLRVGAVIDGAKTRIELWESLSPADRLVILFEEAQLAVIPAGEAELQKPRIRQQVRAAIGLADGNQVLVRADLSDDFVYDLTKLMFEHSDLMQLIYPEVGDLNPGASLMRIQGAAHPGALRFYEKYSKQAAVGLPAAAVDLPTADPPVADLATAEDAATALPEGKSFTVYFGFDDADFDMNQIGVVQEACGYAGTLPAAEFILSGYADTVGPEPYNDGLSLSRAQSVAAVIRNDPRFQDALHLIRFGERDLAVPTTDEVAERRNRRVVFTVVPGEVDQAMLSKIETSAAPSTEMRPQP